MNNRPIIRYFNPEDLKGIRNILNYYILNTFEVYDEKERTAQQMKSWLKEKKLNNFPVLVAEINGKVVGFATYGSFRRWEGYRTSVEHSIYLDKDNHAKGIGRLLMDQLIQLARENGFHSMIGGIDSQNSSSIRFHEKLGFHNRGTLTEIAYKNGKWLSLVLMQKIL